MKNYYTKVESVGDFDGARDIFSCNDCGAHADKPENVIHHKTCKPGESKKWEKFYEENNDDL